MRENWKNTNPVLNESRMYDVGSISFVSNLQISFFLSSIEKKERITLCKILIFEIRVLVKI